MRDRLARAREDGVREEQEPERAALNPLTVKEAREAAPVAGDPFAGEESWGQAFPSETSRRSQNAQEPSPWTSVKLKQKAVPTGKKLDIYVDEEERASVHPD